MGCSRMTSLINAAAFLTTLGLRGTEVALCAHVTFKAARSGSSPHTRRREVPFGAALEPVRFSTRTREIGLPQKATHRTALSGTLLILRCQRSPFAIVLPTPVVFGSPRRQVDQRLVKGRLVVLEILDEHRPAPVDVPRIVQKVIGGFAPQNHAAAVIAGEAILALAGE
jgi:hypothetical protein